MAQDLQTHALYRFYGAGGTLLYIGITNALPRRLGQHHDDKPWWLGVAEVKVEHYPNRKAVLAAEKQAIIAEKPLYNDKHNGGGINKAKAVEPAKPVNHAEAVFAENYFILTADILETFPPDRIAAFMEEARRDAVADDPAWAALTADSALLLGPAASIAWDEVYGSLTRIVEKVEALWRALPEDARREAMAATQAEIKATPGFWIIHMPAILLGHIAAYWAAQAGGEA